MIRTMLLATLFCMSAWAQETPPEAPKPTQETPKKDEVKEALAKASVKTLALDNYKFKSKYDVQGVPIVSGPIEVTGSFVKDKGYTFELEQFGVVYRTGKKVAMKDPETGDWMLVKAGARLGGMGGQAGVLIRGYKVPSEDLKKVEDRFKAIKKKEAAERVGDKDCTVYEGDLTEKGVRDMLPAGFGKLLGKGTFEGKGLIWVNPDGVIVKYQADSSIETEFNGEAIEFTLSQTSEMMDFGAAKVEFPTEVTKLFDAVDAPEEPKKEEPKKE